MPRASIPNYWLREGSLKEYLGRLFPGQAIKIDPGEESYELRVPRELIQDELDQINMLRVDPNKKKKKKKNNN